MTRMRWTQAMSVGVPLLDDDHKGLVALINRLADLSEKASDSADVRQCLMQLMRYTESHFGREQKVMSVCAYPDLSNHIAEHREFVDAILAFTREFDDEPAAQPDKIRRELVDFLQDWLTHHILIQDKAYKPFVEKKLPQANEAAQSFRGSEIWWSR